MSSSLTLGYNRNTTNGSRLERIVMDSKICCKSGRNSLREIVAKNASRSGARCKLELASRKCKRMLGYSMHR